MCGIAGEFATRRQGSVDENSIGRMLSLLEHRGPDDAGVYISPSRQVSLVHRRLSIIDVEGGRQPLCNEDGTIWVSFNGEIYDYRAQREELQKYGHVFRTQTDTEVIVHSYEQFGDDFMSRLRGEFAIALFDERKSALYLVRDRFGIKPLYYAVTDKSVVFGSEIKAIFAHPEIRPAFNRKNVYSSLCGMNLSSETMFQGVQQVEPGCFLKISTQHLEKRRYWDLTFSSIADEPVAVSARKQEDLIAEFRDLLEEAIRLRMVADVDVGVYLSGGIDSGAIACLMAKLSPTRTKAFSIGFGEAQFDESAMAKSVANFAGLDFHLVRIGDGDLASHFLKSLWHAEAPVPTSNGTAKYLLSREARQHVKVVLTGEGSDELLCGYKHFKHQLLLDELHRNPRDKNLKLRMKSFLRESAATPYVAPFDSYPEYDYVTRKFGNYPYTAMRYWQFRKKMNLLMCRDFRREVENVDPLQELASLLGPDKLKGLSTLAATQYTHFKTDLPVFLLSYLGDREEMAHSVEGRVPFLDHKLVEFGSKLPATLKLKDGCEKFCLREAVKNVVPDALRKTEKRMFLSPTFNTLQLGQPGDLSRYLSKEFTQEVGLFDWKIVRFMQFMCRISSVHSPRYVHYEGGLTLILSFHILYDLFIKNFGNYSKQFAGQERSIDYRDFTTISNPEVHIS